MLEVADLVSGYGRARILRGLSFRIGAGELVMLLGRNGAGKSTTLRTVMGLLRAEGGSDVQPGSDQRVDAVGEVGRDRSRMPNQRHAATFERTAKLRVGEQPVDTKQGHGSRPKAVAR